MLANRFLNSARCSLRTRVHHVLVAAATALSVSAISGAALAVPAANQFVLTINDVRDGIANDNFDLWFWNFLYELPGPDRQPGPDATPDGRGGFAYYQGASGALGAIYAYRPDLSAPSRTYGYYIYGAILSSWMAAGHEGGHGYPLSEEVACERSRAQHLCVTGDRVQLFVSFRTNKLTWARWQRATGTVTWHPQ